MSCMRAAGRWSRRCRVSRSSGKSLPDLVLVVTPVACIHKDTHHSPLWITANVIQGRFSSVSSGNASAIELSDRGSGR